MQESLWNQEVDRFRKELLRHHLALSGGNITEAARRLGLDRTYVYVLLRKYDLAVRERTVAS